MSSDGKVIVYEENFGIWKLDVASGKTSEIKIDIAADEKDNEVDVETVTNEVDAFDISPSGRRAVISARGQILTIATDRGDITRARARQDGVAQRVAEMVARRQVHRVRLGSSRAATKSGSAIRKAKTPKKITDLDNEKGALVWTPDSKSLLYTAADKKLYSYTVADAKTAVVTLERRRPHRIGRGLARQQVGDLLEAGPHAALARLHRADRRRRRAPHLGRQPAVLRDQRRLDRRRPLHRLHVRRRVQQRHRNAGRHADDDGAVGAVAAGPGSRSDEPRHRQRSAGAGGRSGGAPERGPRNGGGAPRRRRGQHRLERSGAPRAAAHRAGHGDRRPHAGAGGALGRADASSTGGGGGGRGAAARPTRHGGIYIINVESGQLTRVPPAPPATAGGGAAADAAGRAAAFGGGGNMVFARDGRTLYFRSGSGLFAAPIACNAAPAGGRRAGAAGGGRGGARRRRRRGAGSGGRTRRRRNATARQVTYTANIEVDHKALRAQVFNEGWRIMKNRFYDAKMHGADWNGACGNVRAAARLPRRRGRAAHGHDDDDRSAQRVAHRRQRRPDATAEPTLQTRYPGFDLVADASGFYKVGHIYKDGPADRDYLKIKEGRLHRRGRRSRSEDRRQLLAVLHARARNEVPLPDQRQAGRRTARGT